ncbi:MAG TPA: AI-2E family transporter [Bacteroidia bacterium]|jgi:predicted PurR-regulated permease PerM|nr:AI-2E family transporter [Bacteroidia bacterium]
MKFPLYIKVSLISTGLAAFIALLFVTQRIIVPVICATIIAIVLSPVVNFFVKRKINRIISITITIVLVLSFAGSIILFLCAQGGKLSQSFPVLIDKFYLLLDQSIIWMSNKFNIRPDKLNNWLFNLKSEIINESSSAIGQTLIYTGSALVILVLIPVYIFMILYYQPLLLEFIHRLFKSERHRELNEVLGTIQKIIKNYLVGLLLEAIIIATLNSLSLLLLGIEYAILLGVTGAILNIIPFIGGILAVSLPFLLALATKPSFYYGFMVLVSYIIIQFIDNHYIIPKIVASKVKINALVSVIVVLAGSALWGIPGMLLSIPLTAIIKVVFDHIEGLKSWGFLLGDTMPDVMRTKIKLKGTTNK